jgi:hypothetical protein
MPGMSTLVAEFELNVVMGTLERGKEILRLLPATGLTAHYPIRATEATDWTTSFGHARILRIYINVGYRCRDGSDVDCIICFGRYARHREIWPVARGVEYDPPGSIESCVRLRIRTEKCAFETQ